MPAFCLLLMLLNVCLLLLIVILPAADSLIVILFASDSLLLSVILPATAIERFKVWTESTMKIPMGKCAPRIYNNNWLPGSAATSTFWQTQKQIWNGRSMGQREGGGHAELKERGAVVLKGKGLRPTAHSSPSTPSQSPVGTCSI